MNAQQARELVSKYSNMKEVTELILDIRAAAINGERQVTITSSDMKQLENYESWAISNGYDVSLRKNASTQGDNYAWGYVHSLTVNW